MDKNGGDEGGQIPYHSLTHYYRYIRLLL